MTAGTGGPAGPGGPLAEGSPGAGAAEEADPARATGAVGAVGPVGSGGPVAPGAPVRATGPVAVGTPKSAGGTSGEGGGAPSLTGVFVRLKLSLLRNGLRQSSGRRAAYVVSAVLSLLAAALLVLGLGALRGHPHAANVPLLLMAVVTLGWAVMPLFFPTGDETLDPTRLVLLPLRPQPLVRALLAASLVGFAPLFTGLLAAGSVVTVARGPAGIAFGVVGAALTLLVCVALARAVVAANVRLLTSRRGRDLAVLSGLVIAVGAQVVNFGAQRLGTSGGLARLDPAGAVLRWVPPVSAIGAAEAAGAGRLGTAVLRLALVPVALVALLWLWRRSLGRLMTSPDGSTLQAAPAEGRASAGRSSGLARLLPGGRTGAVMERGLRYVWRDPKTKAAWVTSLAVGLIVPVFNALQGSGTVYFACFAAGMLGIQMYNQFGQDASAFWMVAQTLSSRRDALVELRGRAYTLLAVTLPYATLVSVLTSGLLGAWRALPEVLGLSFALLGAMLATGAWASARFPYSVPREGYKNIAPGQAGLAWISIFGGMVSAAVLCAPVLALDIALHLAGGADRWSWLLLPLGAVYGLLATTAGLRLAATLTIRRLPEILTAVTKG